MNVGEFGNIIRVGVSENISNNINSLEFISPTPSSRKLLINTSKGLTVGVSDISTNIGVLKANTYLQYTTKEGDFNEPGLWQVRVYSKSDTTNKISDNVSTFKVNT